MITSMMGASKVAFVIFSALAGALGLAHGDGRHIPDFSHYAPTQTLIPPFKSTHKGHQHGRLILVGDIHGSLAPLDRLLSSVSFDSSVDTLISLGDFLEKGGVNASLDTLQYLMHHDVKAVRGNHEQPVIEWRGWISWISSLDSQGRPLSPASSSSSSSSSSSATLGPPITYPLLDSFQSTKLSGAEWLSSLTSSFHARPKSQTCESFLHISRHHTHTSLFWNLLPPHLAEDMFDDHYLIASSLTSTQYTWLKSLPSLIHIPDLHIFAMHAGLLPLDPSRPRRAPGQPLAYAPALPPSRHPRNKHDKEGLMQAEQERRLLKNVLQNTRHWTHMHLRSVRKRGLLSGKLTDGEFWADVWGREMNQCGGFRLRSFSEDEDDTYDEDEEEHGDVEVLGKKRHKRDMPCRGSTAIYGHTAALGLDIRRWSMGLDSGCVYGRRLSALVLDRKSLESSVKDRKRGRFNGGAEDQTVMGGRGSIDEAVDEEEDDLEEEGESEEMRLMKVRRKWVRFGERGSARLVQVGCPALAEAD